MQKKLIYKNKQTIFTPLSLVVYKAKVLWNVLETADPIELRYYRVL